MSVRRITLGRAALAAVVALAGATGAAASQGRVVLACSAGAAALALLVAVMRGWQT